MVNTLEKVTGSCLCDEHLTTSLLNQSEAEWPQLNRCMPTWDLALVLHALHGPPFEPLAQAPLWALTHKSVFLTALATAKRRSKLHMFSYKVQHKEDWSSITLQPDPLFVAKTEKAGRPETHLQEVHLRALAPFVGPDVPADTYNCVVGAFKTTWAGCETSARAGRDCSSLTTQSFRGSQASHYFLLDREDHLVWVRPLPGGCCTTLQGQGS